MKSLVEEKVKTGKIWIFALIFVSVVTMVQAQQSAFQGTWIGERWESWGSIIDRSMYRIEITGTNWSEFLNNQIQAAGTVRFSTGRAELFLADGRLAWDLRLLAPGLIEQPISMFAGLYRFRLVQQSTPSQRNPPPTQSSANTLLTENIFIEGFGQLTYSLSNNLAEIENAILLRSGRRVSLSNANWSLNTGLSQNVITVMNRLNVNYSMTITGNSIVVNKRDGNRWYIFWP